MDIQTRSILLLDEFTQKKSTLPSPLSKDALEELRLYFLGKKGALQKLMSDLKELSPDEKRSAGVELNATKQKIEAQLEELQKLFEEQSLQAKLTNERLDVSLPGTRTPMGSVHPITQILQKMCGILESMGFTAMAGPLVDTDHYNFEALNFPPHHPARDMQDTFYVEGTHLLRTHTSNLQLRMMEQNAPPIRKIGYGKSFRNEDVSARSHVVFHQLEAVYINRNVSYLDLIETLRVFLTQLFSADIQMRMRPSYFPFVEPGLEIDISCLICKSKGCAICKHSGWLEIAGGGMIHPNVLMQGQIDPDLYSGFAWGMGIERIAMLFYQISDIRSFTTNDSRFLRQVMQRV